MKHVFITGAEGFIGSHLTQTMLARKYRVTALCRYNFSSDTGNLKHINISKNLSIVHGDITDLPQMLRYTANADYIIHAAALIGIPYSYRAVHSYIDVNIKGTVNVLEAARINKIKRTVIISSSEVYGSAQYTPMDEEHPRCPSSPYAASKLSSEAMAVSYMHSFNTPITVVRPFNAYGPRQTMRAVIPTIITQAISSGTVHIGNTDTIRDFNYVSDIAGGIADALESSKCKNRILNLCSNKAYSIDEILTLIEGIKRVKITIKRDKSRLRPSRSEVNMLLGDNTLASKLIGYSPKTGIHKGLRQTYQWFTEHRTDKPHIYAE